MKFLKKPNLKKRIKIFFSTVTNKNLLKAEIIYPFIYKFFRKYLNHYLWPAHVHSRNYFYPTDKKYKGDLINLGGGLRFFADKWLNIDFLKGFEDGKEVLMGKLV